MILIVGGAGYIGSHAVKSLLDEGKEVIVLDNLSTGHKEAIDERATFINGDIKDKEILDELFTNFPISGVLHFAANCYVGESVVEPLKYYDNNVTGTVSLLSMMNKHKVNNLVFSSTCSVYGHAATNKILESTPTVPINPYGRSKLMVEEIIKDCSRAYALKYVILRYFNVAGADPSGKIGEDHQPETHLIPNILLHFLNKVTEVTIFGTDHQTDDGTCIRDYIHVTDLVRAHVLALNFLQNNRIENKIYNVGNEKGYSVKEVIERCEQVTGRKATIAYKHKREGDPPRLISSSEKIYKDLKWESKYGLDDMIRTAWNWFSRYPDGYKHDSMD